MQSRKCCTVQYQGENKERIAHYRENPDFQKREKLLTCEASLSKQKVSRKLDFSSCEMNSEETGQNNISHCIETFLAETSEGPIYTCSCCRQTNFVQNVQKVSALQPGTHRDMLTRCLMGFKSQENCE